MVREAVEESGLKIRNLGHNFLLLSGRTGSGSVQNYLRPLCSPPQLPALRVHGQ